MTITMLIQLLIVLLALWVGSRYGSLALGAISGIGLAILVFGFGLKPGSPPTDVIYIIIAAVTCAGVLQASGGMDWMIQIAERLQDPAQYHYIYGNHVTTLDKKISNESKRAVYIFLAALGIIVIFSIVQMFGGNLLPSYDTIQAVKGGPSEITIAAGGNVTQTAKQLATAGVVVSTIVAYGLSFFMHTFTGTF